MPQKDKKRPGRPRIDGDVEHQISTLARTMKWTAPAIRRWLQRQEGYKGRIPSEKTIRRVIERNRELDPSLPWSLADPGAEDVADLVLPVLAAVAEATNGVATYFTRAEAEWITKIRRAAPDLTLCVAFGAALAYRSRVAEAANTKNLADTEDLDVFLAFAPWREEESQKRYWSWVRSNRPEWLIKDQTGVTTFFEPAVSGVHLALEAQYSSTGILGMFSGIFVLPEAILNRLCEGAPPVPTTEGEARQ